ncbi:molecular chaperone [Yersinia enterocolitica]|uniref:fimbrial biogenesis chaperone n=1 Tax=Yersinia enterocolitica TaxID=630 RepID=UPI003AB26080
MNIVNGIRYFCLSLSLLSFYNLSYAASGEGLGLDVTRVIFPSTDKSISLRANNTSSKDIWLLRSWITDYYNGSDKTPFFITPPITRINQKESIQLRINKLSDIDSLPNDRESVFSINVMGIPPEGKSQNGGSIKIALNTKIKLFYRPEEINDKKRVSNLFKDLKVKKISGGVEVENPTPYFATLDKIKVNGKLIEDGDYMVSPFSSLKISEKDVRVFTYQLINDFGGWSTPVSIPL